MTIFFKPDKEFDIFDSNGKGYEGIFLYLIIYLDNRV